MRYRIRSALIPVTAGMLLGSGCALAPARQLPATGQTTCWDESGTVISCAGTGQDGDLKKGAPLAHVDNGDGTITDSNTGLMWEKLDNSNTGGIHDWTITYTWDNAFTEKIAGLNADSGFAGHKDWRLPNLNELESIRNLGNFSPAVGAAFNTACAPGCTVTSCSCTQTAGYWSSSTYAFISSNAWSLDFNDGNDLEVNKTLRYYVRAVRGGP